MTEQKQEFEGFIDFGGDVSDIHEPQPLPTGAYDLLVVSAKGIFADKEDGSGQYLKKVNILIDFPDHKDAASMFHTMTLPQPSERAENPKRYNFLVSLVKKFYKQFGLPMPTTGINTTDLIGARATQAFVELDSYDKGDGTPPRLSNKLNLNSIKV